MSNNFTVTKTDDSNRTISGNIEEVVAELKELTKKE